MAVTPTDGDRDVCNKRVRPSSKPRQQRVIKLGKDAHHSKCYRWLLFFFLLMSNERKEEDVSSVRGLS